MIALGMSKLGGEGGRASMYSAVHRWYLECIQGGGAMFDWFALRHCRCASRVDVETRVT